MSGGGVLLKSSRYVLLNFRCTAANVAAALTGSLALYADADDDACKGPAAPAATGIAAD